MAAWTAPVSALVTALVWCVACACLWLRIEADVLALLRAAGKRLSGVQPTAPAPKPEPIPVELLMSLTNESEPWAREQALQQANELYAKYGDWGKVMQALL